MPVDRPGIGIAAIINPLFEHGDVPQRRRREDVLRERGRIQYGGHGFNICLVNNGCDDLSRCLLLGVQAVRCEPVRAAGACGCTGYALLLVVRRTGCRGPSAFGGEGREGLGRRSVAGAGEERVRRLPALKCSVHK